jgi:sodium pump decarboxylase gamma subunit
MSELLEAGLVVTVAGMGVVFVLLTLLVFIIQGMSRLSRLFERNAPAPAAPAPALEAEPEIASVVAAAVALYRNRHGMSD